MMHFGEGGYVTSTKDIICAARALKDGIRAIPELKLMGDPLLSVIAFEGVGVKTYALADLLSRKGWLLNVLQFPPSIHMATTVPSIKTVKLLLDDVKMCVNVLKEDPFAGNGDVSAIYGTAASVSDRSIIADVTFGFLDALTKV